MQIFNEKEKMLDELKMSSQLNDLKVADLQIQQIEALNDDLENNDGKLMGNFANFSELLNATCFKRDSEYIKVDLGKFRSRFCSLNENYKILLSHKQQIKDSCLSFTDIKFKFYENLNKIDTRLNELNLTAALCSPTADLIINELDNIENHF